MITPVDTFESVLKNTEKKDNRVVVGMNVIEGQRVVYFQDDGKNPKRKQFNNLTTYTKIPYAFNGGVNDRGCSISTPDKRVFHAISYHGDLDGWTKDIQAGADGLGIALAYIKDNKIIINDGNSFLLDVCFIEFK